MSVNAAYASHETIFFDPAPAVNVADLPRHGTKGGDGSGGLGLIGIDLFAPNDLSLHFFTVGPFNE